MKTLLTMALFGFAMGAYAEDEDWKPRSTGFLVLEGVYDTELVAPMDAMQHVIGRVEPAPQVFTVGLTTDPVKTAEGLTIVPDLALEDAPPIDVLMVASTSGSRDRDRKNEKLVRWVAERGQESAPRHVALLGCVSARRGRSA